MRDDLVHTLARVAAAAALLFALPAAAVEVYDTRTQAPGEYPPMVDDYCGVDRDLEQGGVVR